MYDTKVGNEAEAIFAPNYYNSRRAHRQKSGILIHILNSADKGKYNTLEARWMVDVWNVWRLWNAEPQKLCWNVKS
jgi:hypothetical protein